MADPIFHIGSLPRAFEPFTPVHRSEKLESTIAAALEKGIRDELGPIPSMSLDKLEQFVGDCRRIGSNTALGDVVLPLCQRVIRAEKHLANVKAELQELKNPAPKDAKGNKLVEGEFYFVTPVNGTEVEGISRLKRDVTGLYIELPNGSRYRVGMNPSFRLHHAPKPS